MQNAWSGDSKSLRVYFSACKTAQNLDETACPAWIYLHRASCKTAQTSDKTAQVFARLLIVHGQRCRRLRDETAQVFARLAILETFRPAWLHSAEHRAGALFAVL